MFPNGATCILADCCVGQLVSYHYKNPTQHVDLEQNAHHHYHNFIEIEQLIKKQSLT